MMKASSVPDPLLGTGGWRRALGARGSGVCWRSEKGQGYHMAVMGSARGSGAPEKSEMQPGRQDTAQRKMYVTITYVIMRPCALKGS